MRAQQILMQGRPVILKWKGEGEDGQMGEMGNQGEQNRYGGPETEFELYELPSPHLPPKEPGQQGMDMDLPRQ
jgi:hypothetical protein